MKLAALAAAVLTAGVLAAPAAAGWQSSQFKSPTGNIVCRAFNGALACGTLNNGNTVVMPLYGKPFNWRGAVLSYNRAVPVLRYGQTWSATPRFFCMSAFDGMTCYGNRSGWWFFINRDTYEISHA